MSGVLFSFKICSTNWRLSLDSIIMARPVFHWHLFNLPTSSWLWWCPFWVVQFLQHRVSYHRISALRFLSSCHHLTHHRELYARTDWPSLRGGYTLADLLSPLWLLFALFRQSLAKNQYALGCWHISAVKNALRWHSHSLTFVWRSAQTNFPPAALLVCRWLLQVQVMRYIHLNILWSVQTALFGALHIQWITRKPQLHLI